MVSDEFELQQVEAENREEKNTTPTHARMSATVDEGQNPHATNSPTNVAEAELSGDAIIEIASSISSLDVSQPPEGTKPTFVEAFNTFLKRILEPIRYVPDPPSITETRTRILEEAANGYPRLAAFQSSETNFSIYRSFRYLHSRVLLDLQDEITGLEKELDELDWNDYDDDPARLRSRELDVLRAEVEGDARTRRIVLAEISTKLLRYDEILIKARALGSFQRPSHHNYRGIRRFHHNTMPLVDAETDAIRTKEDVVTLKSQPEWASLEGIVETSIGQLDYLLKKMFRCYKMPLANLLTTSEMRTKSTNSFIFFYNPTAIEALVKIAVAFVPILMLIGPVLTMYFLDSPSSDGRDEKSSAAGPSAIASRNSLLILIIFTSVFSLIMSLFTKAAKHELFAASAAYCAVLVVFVNEVKCASRIESVEDELARGSECLGV